MEVLAVSHLYISYEEANLNPDAVEVKLFEGFNLQLSSLNRIYLLPSILALSILCIANKTLADTFFAQIEKTQHLGNSQKMPVFWYPRFQEKVLDTQTKTEKPNINSEIPLGYWVQLSFCRTDGWCYITGYTETKPVSIGPNLQPVKKPAWVASIYLCDDTQGPLRDCNINPNTTRSEWGEIKDRIVSPEPGKGNLWMMNGSDLMDGDETQKQDIKRSVELKEFCK